LQKGKKASISLVVPESIHPQYGETYDLIRRREHLMYGYSKMELEALRKEYKIRMGTGEDMEGQMWEVYTYLQDQADVMAAVREKYEIAGDWNGVRRAFGIGARDV
jgi:uncharacterized protein YxjI